MREPGAGIAGERRGEGEAPVAQRDGEDDEREAETSAEIMRESRTRIAMGAQIMRPEFGVGGDRRGHGSRVPQVWRFPQIFRSEPSLDKNPLPQAGAGGLRGRSLLKRDLLTCRRLPSHLLPF